MRRNLALAFLLCFVAATGFAQSRFTGKWATARPANSPLTEAARKQHVQLDVTVEDTKAAGSVATGGLGGTFYTFKDGKVTGNKIEFRTERGLEELTWTMEMVNENTVLLYRGTFQTVGTSFAQPAGLAQGAANDSISGTVSDPGRAMIPGVTVTATNVDNGATLTAMTNEAGRYSFPSLVPGKYSIAASLSGFQTGRVSDLSLGNTPFLQDFTLGSAMGRPAASIPTLASCGTNSAVWCAVLARIK
jgi:hypothetical protein